MSLPNDQPAGARATIASVATALPQHTITQEQVKAYLGLAFSLEPARLEAMLGVVDNAQVCKRHLAFPPDYVIQPRPLSQISREYQEQSVRLGTEAATKALAVAGLEPRDVDLLLTVSCTGFMIPSLDAHLINDLGFRSNVRRLPITELGCAAGAAALGCAADYVRAYPDATALVVSVEIPSLTFQRRDLSQAHLISCILFGDGAAGAVVTGRPAAGARIIGTDSFLFPHSLDAMGFDLKESGFHIVLSKDVPQMIRSNIGELVVRLLERHSLKRDQLSFYLFHPGGQRVLTYMEQELGLDAGQTAASWHVLHQYGNLSSATVLFVLDEFLKRGTPARGEYGLMAAFGPGFSSEMLLLRWN